MFYQNPICYSILESLSRDVIHVFQKSSKRDRVFHFPATLSHIRFTYVVIVILTPFPSITYRACLAVKTATRWCPTTP